MPNDRKLEIGARLRTARILSRLSQQDAALQLQVTQQTVGSWEIGRTLPPLESVYEICMLYGIAPGYLALTQTMPQAARYEYCPEEGRPVCRTLTAVRVL